MNKNYFELVGRVSKEPEMSYSNDGNTAITVFNVAVNTGFGEKQTVDYFRVKCFKTLAENTKKYLEVGQECLIEGRLKTWKQEKDGVTKYGIDLIANNIQFGAKSGKSNGGGGSDQVDEDTVPAEDDFPF